jgi:hypothetical protein
VQVSRLDMNLGSRLTTDPMENMLVHQLQVLERTSRSRVNGVLPCGKYAHTPLAPRPSQNLTNHTMDRHDWSPVYLVIGKINSLNRVQPRSLFSFTIILESGPYEND